ncbi:MAG TPA: cytochrome C oxidase Cbb3, partial [Comamonadaceae bacterium]
MHKIVRLLCAAALAWLAQAQAADAPALYQQHCASCHGAQRTGLMGPALLPESLERIRPAEVVRVIQHGRAATQMPGFADQLGA